MTGRRLYDHFTDAHMAKGRREWRDGLFQVERAYDAWPYLPSHDKAVWNDLARRITPETRRES